MQPDLQLIWVRLATLFLAMVIDLTVGEPPEKTHPTVWMGKYILKAENLALKSRDKRTQRLLGVALAASTILLFSVQHIS